MPADFWSFLQLVATDTKVRRRILGCVANWPNRNEVEALRPLSLARKLRKLVVALRGTGIVQLCAISRGAPKSLSRAKPVV